MDLVQRYVAAISVGEQRRGGEPASSVLGMLYAYFCVAYL